MTKLEAEKAIRHGAIAAAIIGGLTIIVSLFAMFTNNDEGILADYNDPWIIVDIIIVFLLAFFIWKKSRVAAVLMLIYYFVVRVFALFETGQFQGIFISVLILYFLGKAVWGSFVWHRLEKIENPESYRARKKSKWWLWLIGVVGAVFMVLVGVGVAIMTGVIPAVQVQTGTEIPKKQEARLREVDLLQPGEQVRYYYSTGFIDIATDGAILTNKRVLGYWTVNGELDSYGFDIENIKSIERESEGSYLEDAAYNIYSFDDEADYLIIWLSVEEDRHLDMVAAIEKISRDNNDKRQTDKTVTE